MLSTGFPASARNRRWRPAAALAAAAALVLTGSTGPRPTTDISGLAPAAASTRIPGTLTDTSYQPTDFTRQPYVGNGTVTTSMA